MAKIYNLYYDAQGNIKSYHEGGAVAPASETPAGLKLLALEGDIEIWDKRTFRLTHKVDPATLHLIPIKGPKVLTPAEEEEQKPHADAAVLNTTSGEVVPGVTNVPKSVPVEVQTDVHTVRE